MAARGALLQRCTRCGDSADFRCETARVTPPRKVRRAGVDVVVQEFEAYFVCAGCAPEEARAETPPVP